MKLKIIIGMLSSLLCGTLFATKTNVIQIMTNAGQKKESDVEPETKRVIFEMDLPAGKTELLTWLYAEVEVL